MYSALAGACTKIIEGIKNIYNNNSRMRGEKMQSLREKSTVQEKEIKMLADMYKRMTPANRFFMVSASGLLLASQSCVEDGAETGKVAV